ncbi:MAG: hypothetical protein RBS39_11380, partial [Phycisphaerales bacterium]|nr:hypothetical protein [Phycisphaerales bacterium]
GWAIVENTPDEAGEDVRLSLVAGRPVGFTMDLYEPLFAARPEMPVPFMAGVRPKVYEGGGGQSPFTDQGEAADARYELRFRSLGPDASREREANKMQAGRAVLDYPSDWPSPTADDMTRYAARAQAAAGETGEVFQYTLSQPVSVGRQQSAMLPILSTPIDGRRVSIYNRSDLAEHPMRGVEVTNSSDLKLMAGPVSVFDGAAYAGDAQVGNVSTGEKRLIAYAVDLDVASTTKDDSTSTIQTIRIVRGMFELTNKSVNSVSYAFENADAKRGRTIIVEHPKLEGWELVGGAKPAETASGLYRFEVELPAKGKGQFGVRQERVDRQRIGIMDSYDWSTLVQFQRDGKLSQTVLDAVRKAYDMKRAVDEVQRRVDALQGERSTIMNDQGRIRQNMGGIDRTSDLYRRYVEKLSGQENRLEEIEREVEKAKAELDQKRNEFDRYVAGLNVE